MTSTRLRALGSIALAAGCVSIGSTVYAQDSLAKAKTVYAAADYESALTILDGLRTNVTPDDAEEVAVYQFYCLMALGRTDQAKHAIESIVKMDPLYHPSDAQASPRVVTFFEDGRKPLLPQVVRDTYAKAKADFDQKDMAAAMAEFDRVIAVVGDMNSADASLGDIRTLATGFRDLAKAAAAPPPPPPPAPAPAPSGNNAGAASPSSGPSQSQVSATIEAPAPDAVPTKPAADAPTDPNKIYTATDADVKAPAVVSQSMPTWNPTNTFERTTAFSGLLELTIDEQGRVTSSTMRTGTIPRYDAALIRAAAAWKFTPATRNGAPVKYRMSMRIQLSR
jgi:TonB family protein